MFDRLRTNLNEQKYKMRRTAAVITVAGSAALTGCGHNVTIMPLKPLIPNTTTTAPDTSGIKANCKGFSFITEPGVLHSPVETTTTGNSSDVYYANNEGSTMIMLQTIQPDRLHVVPNQYIHDAFVLSTDGTHTATFQEPDLVVTMTEHGQISPTDHNVYVDFSACPKSQV